MGKSPKPGLGSPGPAARLLSTGLVCTATVVAWAVMAYLAAVMRGEHGVSLWYPGAGATLAILLVGGWRAWPLPLLGMLTANLLLWPPQDPGRVALLGLAHVGVYGAAAAVLGGGVRHWDFGSPERMPRFLITAATAAVIMAGIGTTYLALSGDVGVQAMPEALLHWWMGDFIGLITVAPFLILFLAAPVQRWLSGNRAAPPRRGAFDPLRPGLLSLQMLVSAGVLAGVILVTTYVGSSAARPYAMLFLLLPMTWVVTTGGLRAAALATVAYSVGIATMVHLTGQGHDAWEYQSVMIALATAGLVTGSVMRSHLASIARFRDMAEASNDLLWELDSGGQFTEVTGELVRGVGLEGWTGTRWRDHLVDDQPTDLREVQAAMDACLPFHDRTLRFRLHDGQVIWTSNNGMPVFDGDGHFRGYRGTTADITARRRAEAVIRDYNELLEAEVRGRTQALIDANDELSRSEARFRALSASAPVGIYEADRNGRCVFVNDHWCELTGRSHRQALGTTLVETVHPEDRERVSRRWLEAGGDETRVSLEYRVVASDGRVLWVLGNSTALKDRNGRVGGYIDALIDIQESKEKEARIWTMANFDTLTGLPNRNLFFDRMDRALRNATRNRELMALLLIDLDGFKPINDRHGHAVGDELLKQVAVRLSTCLRASDTAARMGGDEFTVVLLDLSDAAAAGNVAAKIVSTLAEPFVIGEHRLSISASVGIAICPDHSTEVNELLRMADAAMYRAKHRGKNTFQLFAG